MLRKRNISSSPELGKSNASNGSSHGKTIHMRGNGSLSLASSSFNLVLVLLAVIILLCLLNFYGIRTINLNNKEHIDLLINAVQLPHDDGSFIDERPRVWILGKRLESGYLKHVFDVFERLGYRTVNGSKESWDVLWSHDYPFVQSILSPDLEDHQKVNHFPGSGFITNKVSLATSNLKHIPKAFHLPKEKEKFLKHAKENQDKLWVKKSNEHRGIKIEHLDQMDLDSTGTFVQEYIANPHLIDGKKYDIGLYVTLTSVNPLRVYIYDNDVLLRFCAKPYHPFNSSDTESYVVADDYTPTWEIPSLQKYFVELNMNMKQSFNAYLKEMGKDPMHVWKQIEDAITTVYMAKEENIIRLTSAFPSQRHFFEMVRFDFALDEDLNVFLMEANMSPNLSSLHFAPNKLLYEQVIFNLLSLVGLANTVSTKLWPTRSKDFYNMMVSDKDLSVLESLCTSAECRLSCKNVNCKICFHCLDESMKLTLKDAYLEMTSKWLNKRLIPSTHDPSRQPNGTKSDLQTLWFKGKCLQDASWCS